MSAVEKRSVSLSPELAAAVDEAVESGAYGNASEVVRDALRQWKERRELLGYTVEELRLLWRQGIESGPGHFCDIDDLKEEGRRRLAARKVQASER